MAGGPTVTAPVQAVSVRDDLRRGIMPAPTGQIVHSFASRVRLSRYPRRVFRSERFRLLNHFSAAATHRSALKAASSALQQRGGTTSVTH